MPKKIFELAKELDMGPLDLVENLKAKGYDVRNHMTALSDEDVTKVLAEFQAKADEMAQASKTTKKKTVTKKKKVAKKKSASKKVVTVKEGEEEAGAPKTKKKVAKKKTVIRRKTSKREEMAEEQEAAAEHEVLETSEREVTTPPREKVETGGLRVVARPEVEEQEAPVKAEEKKEIYREKVHKFTPVYIPKAEEVSDKKETVETAEEGEEGKDKKETGKKRLGGLASMMSGKKAASKSQALIQTRADEELKSYAALSGSGRPIYTQVKKKRAYSGPSKSTEITEVKEAKRVVKLHHGSTITDLARKLRVKLKELVDACLDLNLLVKGDDYVGIQLATEIAALYDYRVEDVSFDEDEVIGRKKLSEEEKEKLPLRDPIITIMGHVDHGKTTLLDYIRKAKVAAAEAGGITQHIGAYSVTTEGGKRLTFLDTPGHAAFGAMRQRGANVTDIVVLVVAADDGVMPQTRESIRFIENSGNPMIVAINKMDKEDANPDRVKQELTEFNITPEEWGGDTQMVPVSALKGDGVDDLLEAIALQAEIMELRADPKGSTEGVVIESKVEPGRGPVATVLVQTGTLTKGDSIVVGETYGRARSLTDHVGKQLKSAGPSIPVQILGLNDAPAPGDIMNIVKNEREAKKIVQNRVDERKKLEATPVASKKAVSLEDFFASAPIDGQEKKSLNLIVRSDVQGSYEAIKQSLEPLSNNEVEVKIIGGGVGPISDSDVTLADASSAIIIGFNMRPVTSARRMAEEKGIDVRTYSIIYELINDVKLALEGMLEPEFVEKYIGRAEVRETFTVPKVGTIAGSQVIDGSIQIAANIRLLRDGKIIYEGKISSLKRFKDDVKEVKSGYECGVGLENFNDVKVGDLYEAFIMEERKRKLDDVMAASQKSKEATTETTL